MASEGSDTGGPSEPAATSVKTTLLSVASIQVCSQRREAVPSYKGEGEYPETAQTSHYRDHGDKHLIHTDISRSLEARAWYIIVSQARPTSASGSGLRDKVYQ